MEGKDRIGKMAELTLFRKNYHLYCVKD